MLDLNSKSFFPDRVNWHIDQGMLARQEAPRTYLGCSSLGSQCERAVQYGLLHVPRDKARDGNGLRILAAGHIMESLAIRCMREGGFVLLDVDPATGQQWEVSFLDGRVLGHADGVIAFFRGQGEAPFPLPAVWEHKRLGSKAWKQLVKAGKVREFRPEYFAQMQLYMGGLGIKNGLLTATNADTLELHHELVPFEQGALDSLLARAGRLLLLCEHGEMVPRNPEDFRCNLCGWRETCGNER